MKISIKIKITKAGTKLNIINKNNSKKLTKVMKKKLTIIR